MKNLLVLFSALSITIVACGQKLKEKDVPAAVKEAFQKQFGSAKEVEWEKRKESLRLSLNKTTRR